MMGNKTRTILIVVVVAAFAMFSYRGCYQYSIGNVTSKIEKDMPIGTQRAEVIALLDIWGFDHSGHDEVEIFPNAIYAIKRNSKFSIIVTTDLRIEFHFDDDDNLVEYSLEELYTGL